MENIFVSSRVFTIHPCIFFFYFKKNHPCKLLTVISRFVTKILWWQT